jgi:pyruvate kinase
MIETMRKTKIVCTLGPATHAPETLRALLEAGMNVARLNYAHGDHDSHRETIQRLREASRATGIPVAILADVKGPEIRTGDVPDGKPVRLATGSRITVDASGDPVTDRHVSLSYKNLARDARPGVRILIADGLVELLVEEIKGDALVCLVKNGGEIGSRKNVNLIGVRPSLPAITEKDVKDILFSIENGVDFIAASFIRRPENVREIRGIVGVADAPTEIIAKIEDREGLDNIDEIIRVADGVMVARGDLGVQLSAPEIPIVQKRIIRKCNAAGKPVITATQMLDSMIKNPVPTRAEATDVANAVFDGTDAVMLSGETASGAYPVQAVETMHRIALAAERSEEFRERCREAFSATRRTGVADSMAGAAYLTASGIGARIILTPTLRGHTPRLISRFRPEPVIVAVTPDPAVQRRLLLAWGVAPVLSMVTHESDTMIDNAIAAAEKAGLLKPFDKAVILAGIPVDSPIMLNTVRVHLHCRVLAKSRRGYGRRAAGRIVKVADLAEAERRIAGTGDEILLTRYLDPSFYPVLEKVPGYILEEFSAMSWEEIRRHNPNLVALAGTPDAFKVLSDGDVVTLDGEEKLVYEGKAEEEGNHG